MTKEKKIMSLEGSANMTNPKSLNRLEIIQSIKKLSDEFNSSELKEMAERLHEVELKEREILSKVKNDLGVSSKKLTIILPFWEDLETIEDALNTIDHSLVAIAEKAQHEHTPEYEVFVNFLVEIQKALRKNLVRHLQKSPH